MCNFGVLYSLKDATPSPFSSKISIANLPPLPVPNQNQNPFEKKLATLAARAVFVNLFFQKQLIYDFLAGNNYPDSPHSQGGIKFATQISPLLHYKFSVSCVCNCREGEWCTMIARIAYSDQNIVQNDMCIFILP